MKKRNSIYFRLYAHCIPVKGYRRSIIYDLQRHDFEIIPNELYHFTRLLEKEPLEQIKANSDAGDIQIIDEYVSFLIDKDFGFYQLKSELHLFPKIDYAWHSYSSIENCILEVTKLTLCHSRKLRDILEATNCENIALKIGGDFDRESIMRLLKIFDSSIVCNIYIYTIAEDIDDFEFFENVAAANKRVKRIYIDPSFQALSYPTKKTQLLYPSKLNMLILFYAPRK